MPDYNDTEAIHRLTGRAYFAPQGSEAQIDLGNIRMHKLDFNLKRKSHLTSRRGILYSDRNDTYSSDARFTIEGDEYAQPLLALIHLGTPGADIVQSASDTGSKTFASGVLPGYCYDLGAWNVSNVALAGFVEGTDFVVDYVKGKIYVPVNSGITAGSRTFTFKQQSVLMNSMTMLNQLDRIGSMQVYEEDSFQLSPRNLFSFACQLSADSAGETKPDDYKKFTLIASVIGTITRLTLGVAFEDLLFDDGSIVDFS
jgi:hypothetical protein